MILESFRNSKIADAINSGGVASLSPPAYCFNASGIRRNEHFANTSTTGKNHGVAPSDTQKPRFRQTTVTIVMSLF